MRSRSVRLGVLVIATALAGALVPAPATATPAPGQRATCQGERATIVGHRNGKVFGSDRRDVVVTNGALVVATKGGPDLICVTGGRVGRVASGDGNDRVVVLTSDGGSYRLGRGADKFLGGPGRDSVTADHPRERSDSHDVILTRGGDDEVDAGLDDEPLRDAVDTGSGTDRIRLNHLRQRPGAPPVDGGPGADAVTVRGPHGPGTGSWTIDNRRGRLLRESRLVLRVQGLEKYVLSFARGPATFLGGPRDETFYLDGGDRVAAGAGDDTIGVRAADDTDVSELDGQGGRDLLAFDFHPTDVDALVTADLTTDVIRSESGLQQEFIGFEGLSLNTGRGEVVGDEGPNDLFVRACVATVRGGGGDDEIASLRFEGEFYVCQRPDGRTAHLLGESGDDRLTSHPTSTDLIDGGPGTDTATGNEAGDDVCVQVERTTHCTIEVGDRR